MSNEQIADFLKGEIYKIEKSKEEAKTDPDGRIVTVHINAEIFLKMAYLFVGIHGGSPSEF